MSDYLIVIGTCHVCYSFFLEATSTHTLSQQSRQSVLLVLGIFLFVSVRASLCAPWLILRNNWLTLLHLIDKETRIILNILGRSHVLISLQALYFSHFKCQSKFIFHHFWNCRCFQSHLQNSSSKAQEISILSDGLELPSTTSPLGFNYLCFKKKMNKKIGNIKTVGWHNATLLKYSFYRWIICLGFFITSLAVTESVRPLVQGAAVDWLVEFLWKYEGSIAWFLSNLRKECR